MHYYLLFVIFLGAFLRSKIKRSFVMDSLIINFLVFYFFYNFKLKCVLTYLYLNKFLLESSKGIYCIFLTNYYFWTTNIISNDYLTVFQLNAFCRIYNVGNLIAVLGSIDFVLGSIDLR